MLKHQKQATYEEQEIYLAKLQTAQHGGTLPGLGFPGSIMPWSMATAEMCEGRNVHLLEQETREGGPVDHCSNLLSRAAQGPRRII